LDTLVLCVAWTILWKYI